MAKFTLKCDVLATNAVVAAICHAAQKRLGVHDRQTVRVFVSHGWTVAPWEELSSRATPLIVVSSIADIPHELSASTRSSHGRYYLFTEGMPPESFTSRIVGLNVHDSKRLQIDAENDQGKRTNLIERMLRGYVEDKYVPIVDAWWEGDKAEELVILSPRFDRLRICRSLLSGLLGNDSRKLARFEIDPDGSFLFWEHADVHLGWEQLRALVDPLAAAKALAEKRDFAIQYGNAIRELRESRGVSQSSFAGMTPRHLRRIESGEQFPTRKMLAALAGGQGLGIDEYLAELAAIL